MSGDGGWGRHGTGRPPTPLKGLFKKSYQAGEASYQDALRLSGPRARRHFGHCIQEILKGENLNCIKVCTKNPDKRPACKKRENTHCFCLRLRLLGKKPRECGLRRGHGTRSPSMREPANMPYPFFGVRTSFLLLFAHSTAFSYMAAWPPLKKEGCAQRKAHPFLASVLFGKI